MASLESAYAERAAAVVAAQDWDAIAQELNTQGYAVLKGLLSPEACAAVAGLYDTEGLFRSRVVMARYNFGRGEYQYFAYPLPLVIAALRQALYPHLAAIANRWADMLGTGLYYPEQHEAFLTRCHEAGQLRPTPLLLRYGPGDYNCLHQDLYGAHVFPIQAAVLLSRPGEDFTGGEFVLTEQRPRMQSRAEVVRWSQGDAVIFPVNERPVMGSRGYYRVAMRHGVSRLHEGRRHVLGVIFHDAQ